MAVEISRRYTFGDLWDFPDDGKRRELVDGVLYVSPSPRIPHQRVVSYLTHVVWGWIETHGGEVLPGANVNLSDDTHFEPDVLIFAQTPAVDDGLSFAFPPDIVVEVSAPSTRSFDLGVKRDRYRQAGAPEFWFVDLDHDEILVWVRGPDGYGDATILHPGDTLTSLQLPDLALDVAHVLSGGR